MECSGRALLVVVVRAVSVGKERPDRRGCGIWASELDYGIENLLRDGG
jgi:hypothetical protein